MTAGNHKRLYLRQTTALLAILLAGCTVGPDFKKPAAPAVDRYTPQPVGATSSDGGNRP